MGAPCRLDSTLKTITWNQTTILENGESYLKITLDEVNRLSTIFKSEWNNKGLRFAKKAESHENLRKVAEVKTIEIKALHEATIKVLKTETIDPKDLPQLTAISEIAGSSMKYYKEVSSPMFSGPVNIFFLSAALFTGAQLISVVAMFVLKSPTLGVVSIVYGLTALSFLSLEKLYLVAVRFLTTHAESDLNRKIKAFEWGKGWVVINPWTP